MRAKEGPRASVGAGRQPGRSCSGLGFSLSEMRGYCGGWESEEICFDLLERATVSDHSRRKSQPDRQMGRPLGVPLLDTSTAQPRTVVNHTERREGSDVFCRIDSRFSGGLAERMKNKAERDCCWRELYITGRRCESL